MRSWSKRALRARPRKLSECICRDLLARANFPLICTLVIKCSNFSMSAFGTLKSSCTCLCRPFNKAPLRHTLFARRDSTASQYRKIICCQEGEERDSVGGKVPAAAQRTLDALSALLGTGESDNKQTDSEAPPGKLLEVLYS